MAVLSEIAREELISQFVALTVVMIRHAIMRHMEKLAEPIRTQGLDECEGSD